MMNDIGNRRFLGCGSLPYIDAWDNLVIDVDVIVRPFLYLLARQCRINRLSFSTMAGVRVCS